MLIVILTYLNSFGEAFLASWKNEKGDIKNVVYKHFTQDDYTNTREILNYIVMKDFVLASYIPSFYRITVGDDGKANGFLIEYFPEGSLSIEKIKSIVGNQSKLYRKIFFTKIALDIACGLLV